MAPDHNALIVKFSREAFYAVISGALLSSFGAPLIWSYVSTAAELDLLLNQAKRMLLASVGIGLIPFFVISYFAVERRGWVLAFASLCWVATLVMVAGASSSPTNGTVLYWLFGATLSLALTLSLFLIFAKVKERT